MTEPAAPDGPKRPDAPAEVPAIDGIAVMREVLLDKLERFLERLLERLRGYRARTRRSLTR